jgi:uncharacterized membrane protein YdjX (TVP38/TMEM64 family)
MGKLADLFEKHQFVRRSLVIWAVCLITWVVVIVFSDIAAITAAAASAFGMVIGILATVIGFYQWARSQDGKQ